MNLPLYMSQYESAAQDWPGQSHIIVVNSSSSYSRSPSVYVCMYTGMFKAAPLSLQRRTWLPVCVSVFLKLSHSVVMSLFSFSSFFINTFTT